MISPHAEYYTYILQCADGTYYIGKTNNLEKRILQHNGVMSGGAKYTRNRRPVELKYFEKHPTNKFACHREACLRQLTRRQKEELIIQK